MPSLTSLTTSCLSLPLLPHNMVHHHTWAHMKTHNTTLGVEERLTIALGGYTLDQHHIGEVDNSSRGIQTGSTSHWRLKRG